MPRFSYMVIILALLILAGGTVFLATWDIPPPSAVVEKEMPDDRFPR